MSNSNPSLFGINNSNRDFTLKKTWGKNQFNSSFPAALMAYMSSKNLPLIYLTLENNLLVSHTKESCISLLKVDPLSKDTFYSFETQFISHVDMVVNSLDRSDLVICTKTATDMKQHINLEIKLTAIPDQTTFELPENKYSSELVIRPSTIVELAISISKKFVHSKDSLTEMLSRIENAEIDWLDSQSISSHWSDIVSTLDTILVATNNQQRPLMLQPIWKTEGKSFVLHDQCFDMFVWSDNALTRLFVDTAKVGRKINRSARTIIWLIKMLSDYAVKDKINAKYIIDHYTYDNKNDKAFAVNGKITYKYLKCNELSEPRVSRSSLKEIILGGGQKMLSPERRFDAAILSQENLF